MLKCTFGHLLHLGRVSWYPFPVKRSGTATNGGNCLHRQFDWLMSVRYSITRFGLICLAYVRRRAVQFRRSSTDGNYHVCWNASIIQYVIALPGPDITVCISISMSNVRISSQSRKRPPPIALSQRQFPMPDLILVRVRRETLGTSH